MATSLTEFCTYTDKLLDARAFNDYCPNGLQVEGSSVIKKSAAAVSASLAVIEAAVKAEVQLLLVHHGLFWNRDPYVVTGIKKKKLQLLLEHGISLVAYHLPLDAHQELGNNWKAAHEMGWKNLKPFCYNNGSFIGVSGSFAKRSRADFQRQLEEYYGQPAHVALGGTSTVKSAALISGGAHKNIVDAVQLGVDCYVTGSFDEPIWHQAYEEKINFFAVGHAASERIGPRALGEHLAKKFKLAHLLLDEPNPF